MRHRLLNGLLAALPLAALPAQDARAELQRAIVTDEQEHDLGKAEAMYQKLLDGNALGDAERAEVALRLGKVLQRLGKSEQATAMLQRAAKSGGDVGKEAQKALAAQGQDGEREKQLREQAREVVRKALASGTQGDARQCLVWGIADQEVSRNLLWLGDAAVPEIVTALEPIVAKLSEASWPEDITYGLPQYRPVSGLMGLLWKYGGKQAQGFLAKVAASDSMGLRIACVGAASFVERTDMLPTVCLFLRDPAAGAPVQAALLNAPDTLLSRIPAPELLGAATAGSKALKGVVLRTLARRWRAINHTVSKAATLELTLPLVREALGSTDPEFGRCGQEFLLSDAIMQLPAGIELLLREYPKLNIPNTNPKEVPVQDHDSAMRLLPALLDAARALGPVAEGGSSARVPARQQWLGYSAARGILGNADASALPQVMDLIDLGYDVASGSWLVYWLAPDKEPCRVRSDQAEAVFERIDRAADSNGILRVLSRLDLPASMWPRLQQKAEEWQREDKNIGAFLAPIAHTGVPEAATWLLQLAQQTTNRDLPPYVADMLIELGRRTQKEPVRAAMRELLRSTTLSRGITTSNGTTIHPRARLLLALGSMGDPAPIVGLDSSATDEELHPYATGEFSKRTITPLDYMLGRSFEPPCRFTHAQVIEALRGLDKLTPIYVVLRNDRDLDFVAKDLLIELSDLVVNGYARMVDGANARNVRDLVRPIVVQLLRRAADSAEAVAGELRAWCERRLSADDSNQRYAMLMLLEKEDVPLLRAAIEARVDDEDERCALQAATLLIYSDSVTNAEWLRRLLQSPVAEIRRRAIGWVAWHLGGSVAALVLPALRDDAANVRHDACAYFGAIVSKDAVPDLLVCLKDTDGDVRTAAAEALQKIRFYHEQQAHWDRILHGVDASIPNVAEKLLAQGKPAQPREQRLLAIQSLADLGAPEALPFLIDWMNDKDADIAAAARSAITAIHQRAGAK